MIRASALQAIREKLLVPNEKTKRANNDATTLGNNKRQKTGGIDTSFGSTGLLALHQSGRRDQRQQKEQLTKEKNEMIQERENIDDALDALDKRKRKLNGIQTVGNGNNEIEQYWEVKSTSDQADLVLILRMFAPDCKCISKSKSVQWTYIQSKYLENMSQVKMDSKEEEM